MAASSPGRVRLLGWSVLLSLAGVLALVGIAPVLLVSVLLVPFGVGVPMTAAVLGWVRGAADAHRLWAVRVMGTAIPRPYRAGQLTGGPADRLRAMSSDPATWRDVRWLPANFFAGVVVAGVPAASVLLTIGMVGFFVERMTEPARRTVDLLRALPGQLPMAVLEAQQPDRGWLMLVGAAVFLGSFVLLTKPAMRAYTTFLHWSLAPAESTRLAKRIDELTQTRAETLDTQAAEIRRIERDLHDGAQARLVSLGMNLGMAEKLLVSDPAAALRLLSDAKQSTGHALSELRELVHGIHPPILADRGLDGAAQALALANPMPVTVSVDLPARPPAPVESAMYFALTEVLTNITKHSAAATAWIRIDYHHGRLSVVVADNGMGGATRTPGGGLHGIERRLAAFDGTLTVASPTGGPTIVTMEVPCQLVSVSS